MNEFVIFYDGCHKIYYAHLSDVDTIEKMRSYGYTDDDIIPVEDADGYGDARMVMGNLWEISCPLRFISPASLDDDLPEIRQFDDDIELFLSNFYDFFS